MLFAALVSHVAGQVGPAHAVRGLDSNRVRDRAEGPAYVGCVCDVAVCREEDCAVAGSVGGVADVGLARLGRCAGGDGVPPDFVVFERLLQLFVEFFFFFWRGRGMSSRGGLLCGRARWEREKWLGSVVAEEPLSLSAMLMGISCILGAKRKCILYSQRVRITRMEL